MTALTLVCPVCAATFPVEAGLHDAAARQALKAALSLWPPALSAPLFGYLALHRPAKQALRLPKLARLLDELVELVSSGTVTRHRETRPADPTAWGAGLAEVLKLAEAGTLTLPLQGHGLLAEIVHRQAGQRQTQTQRATAPLHPSHRDWQRPAEDPASGDSRPAPAASPVPPVPPSPAAASQDPAPVPRASRAAGLAAIGPLAQALLGRRGARDDPEPGPATPNPQPPTLNPNPLPQET